MRGVDYFVCVSAASVEGNRIADDMVRQVEVPRQILANRSHQLPVGLACTFVTGIRKA
jgi:hypothetical protein